MVALIVCPRVTIAACTNQGAPSSYSFRDSCAPHFKDEKTSPEWQSNLAEVTQPVFVPQGLGIPE